MSAPSRPLPFASLSLWPRRSLVQASKRALRPQAPVINGQRRAHLKPTGRPAAHSFVRSFGAPKREQSGARPANWTPPTSCSSCFWHLRGINVTERRVALRAVTPDAARKKPPKAPPPQ